MENCPMGQSLHPQKKLNERKEKMFEKTWTK
jgi:hypothetical protein